MNIVEAQPNIERFEKFQSLLAGQYWRATKDIHRKGIEKGTVLLIESIRWVDNLQHTIILRAHPDKIGTDAYVEVPQPDGKVVEKWIRYDEHRFLLAEFSESFEYEPDHQKVRTQEMLNVQAQITAIQAELMEVQSNPALMLKIVEDQLGDESTECKDDENDNGDALDNLPMAHSNSATPEIVSMVTGSLANAIGSGITVAKIDAMKQAADREHKIATIKTKWITSKTNEIAETIQRLTPYYAEQAACALAKSEDVLNHVKKLQEGIQSLDLYVGKDVEVETICQGKSAAADVPLTFVQKKLIMDEELAVWSSVDKWFDFSKQSLFFEALRNNPGLVNQVFPTERCALVMASTSRYIDYGDSLTNVKRNAINKMVFLLIRDGENMHCVYSPITSHLHTARLFPSKDDHDQIFRGTDASDIKFDDICYTDALAKHDQYALHYKRFLILACGLDHRLKLFGDFYDGPQSLSFISKDFQDKFCRFLHDDDGEGMLPTEERMPLHKYIAEKNAYLRSGSRVLCLWSALLTPETAPGACKYDDHRRSGFNRQYAPKTEISTEIAVRSGDSICVNVLVSGHSWRMGEDREFTCKVNLSAYPQSRIQSDSTPYLCLDAVKAEELQWYIQNRRVRSDYLTYIKLFKLAIKHLEQEALEERETRERMASALVEGNVIAANDAPEIVQQAVIAWRAANRGKALPKVGGGNSHSAWVKLLDQMFLLAGEGKRRIAEVESFVTALGYKPLRLVISGAARLVVYAEPLQSERDDRLEPHKWVHRITLDLKKTGYVEQLKAWVLLPKQAASETTLHEWESAGEWAGLSSVFSSFEQKSKIFGVADRFKERLAVFTNNLSGDEFSSLFNEWSQLRNKMLEKCKRVENPGLGIPFAVIMNKRHGKLNYLCVGTNQPHGLLHNLSTNEIDQKKLQNDFVKKYMNKGTGQNYFEKPVEWELFCLPISYADEKYGPFVDVRNDSYHRIDKRNAVNPLLSDWLGRWTKNYEEDFLIHMDNSLLFSNNDSFIADAMLGITLPENFDPVTLVNFRVFTDDDSDTHKYSKYFHWIDICPKPVADLDDSYFNSARDKYFSSLIPKSFPSRRSSVGRTVKQNLSSAREHIQKVALDEYGKTCTPTLSTELPDVPQPPEGVERWYLINFQETNI